jgi:ATP-dependent Clp protease adaptor protein ClpS
VFRSVEIKLSLPIVLPLLDMIRERIAATDATRISQTDTSDLRTLLALFKPNFPKTGVITVRGNKALAVLRACSFLRIEIRKKDLSAMSDAAMEAGEGMDPKTCTGENHRGVMCYLFLATVQQVLLNHFVAQASPFSLGLRALKDVSVRIRNLFGARREAPEPAPQLRTALATPEPGKKWEVVVLNDPINLMTYVTTAFQIVLGLTAEVARQRMGEVHEAKNSTVFVGPREKAEAHVLALQAWHLIAVVRPSDST